MVKHSESKLKLAASALVFTSYLALAATENGSPDILLIPLAAILIMPLTERLDSRFPVFRKLTTGVTFLFILSLPLIWSRTHLILTLTALITYVQIYSLLHKKEGQNYNHILFMSFFLVLVAIASTPTPGIALVFLLFLPACAATLVSLEAYTAGRAVERTMPVALVPLTQKELSLHRPRPRRIDILFNSWIFVSTLLIAGVAAAFFVMIPRVQVGILAQAGVPNAFTTGLSSEVDLAAGGTIDLDPTPVFVATFPEEEGGLYDDELFWRTTSFDKYTGSGWTRQGVRWFGSNLNQYARRFSVFGGPRGSHEGIDRIDLSGDRIVRQDIFLNAPPETGLPALSLLKRLIPHKNSGKYRFAWDPAGDFTARMHPMSQSGVSYSVWSSMNRPSDEKLRASPGHFDRYIWPVDFELLTDQNLRPETLELIRRVTRDAPTAFDKVLAIEVWLTQGEFTYSLNIPDLPDDHPIDAFIHDTKMGHCELYASAMALSLRSLGIPSRVVSGYRGGIWNANDRSYLVRADMAHLWVEVFFPQYGWLTFDPSPEQERVGSTVAGQLYETFSRLTLNAKLIWLRNIMGFTKDDRTELFDDFSLGIFSAASITPETGSSKSKDRVVMVGPRPQTLAVLAFVILVLFSASLGFRFLRVRKSMPLLNDDQKRAVRLHANLVSKMTQLGIGCQGRTVEEILKNAMGLRRHDAERIVPVIAAYNGARFGRRSLARDEYDDFRATIRSLGLQSP